MAYTTLTKGYATNLGTKLSITSAFMEYWGEPELTDVAACSSDMIIDLKFENEITRHVAMTSCIGAVKPGDADIMHRRGQA